MGRTARHGERNISQLRIEYLPLADLKPYENNARTHSADQVAQIATSMRTFGWTNPILVDEAGNIIAGHGRLAAAVHLGLAEVPTIRLEGLSDQQRRALTLADNKLAMNAGWDEKLLVAELKGLGDLQGLVGFSQDELMRLQTMLHKTIVFITHDFDEAIRLADRIAIMKDGEIIQVGSPEQLVVDPATSYVAEFTRDVHRAKVISARSLMRALDGSEHGGTVSPDAKIASFSASIVASGKPFAVVNGTGKPIGEVTPQAVIELLAGIESPRAGA